MAGEGGTCVGTDCIETCWSSSSDNVSVMESQLEASDRFFCPEHQLYCKRLLRQIAHSNALYEALQARMISLLVAMRLTIVSEMSSGFRKPQPSLFMSILIQEIEGCMPCAPVCWRAGQGVHSPCIFRRFFLSFNSTSRNGQMTIDR